jgi:hypothetical protein
MNLNDRELLARTLQAEAGNQGLGGMIAAGSVIMNRVGGGYGSNVRDVILAPGQFSAWNSLTGYAGGEQGQNMDFTPSAEAYKAADTLLSGQYEDITGGATHYYNPAISQPSWGQGGNWKRIGDHVFGKADAGRQKGTQAMNRQQPSAQQMQQMQQQPQQGGLMGFLRNPRTREALLSMDQSGMFEGLRQRATADVQVQQEQEALAAEEAKAQKQRSAALQQQQQVTNRTMQVLAQRAEAGDALAGQVLAAIQSGAMDPAAGMKLYLEQSTKAPKETFTSVSGAQLNEQRGTNLDPEKMYNVSSSGKITQVGGGGVTIEGDPGVDEFAKQDAKTLSETFSTGVTASSNLNKINRLASLLGNIETGSAANLKLIAGRFGIETEGLDEIQAVDALISQLVPAQRPAGSGPMSDEDLKLFKQSLPQIINQPGGNKIIVETLRGIAQYDAMGAQIVQRYRTGEISEAQAFQQLMDRPDPFGAQIDASTYLPTGQ